MFFFKPKKQGIEVSKTTKLTSFKQVSSVASLDSKNWSDESDTESFDKIKVCIKQQVGKDRNF